MVYYLGKDVEVYITTETGEAGVKVTSDKCIVDTGSDATTHFGHKLAAGSLTTTGNNVTDLTGVDIGIGVQDEDISYVGRMNILKAEIKKETTVSLTRKKSGAEWDTIYCGPTTDTHEYDDGTLDHGARWGVAYRASGGGASTAYLISNGLISPADHGEATGTDVTFGYRVHVQLKSGGQWLSIPGCQITGHTVSINGDGTSEETLEFSTNVDIKIGATAGDVAVLTADDM
jgi:hypothetical protein